MIQTLIIVILTCLSMMLCILFKLTIKIKNASIQTFWIASLIGAVLILLFKCLPVNNLIISLSNSSINPIKISILFISLSIISITLDCLGFFKYLAIKVAKKAKNSQC